jgi:hypothetical protein
VNGDNGYIAMQVSGLEVLPGGGLTDSGRKKTSPKSVKASLKHLFEVNGSNFFVSDIAFSISDKE